MSRGYLGCFNVANKGRTLLGMAARPHARESLPVLSTQERLQICAGCPMLVRPLWQCNPFKTLNGKRGCGCFVKVKARLQSEHCPAGMW